MKSEKDYLLGVNDFELNRLHFQHGVWKKVTDGFLNKTGLQKGWKVLDAGSGPGFVSFDIRKLIGDTGEITALEPSEVYLDHFRNFASENEWKNAETILGTAESAALPENYFDMVFSRWVIGFVPDPVKFISSLAGSLKPGGIIALQDYAFHGLNLIPRGGAYDKLPPYVMEYWKTTGGDLQIAERIPKIFKELGLEQIIYEPHSLAGDPESGIFKWHDLFITHHIPQMVQKGIMPSDIAEEILNDWNAHKNNPDSIFFSPLVVDMAARK